MLKSKKTILFLISGIVIFVFIIALSLNGFNNQKNMSINKTKEDNSGLDFNLQLVEGGSIVLSEQNAEYMLINFWAIRCPYCIMQMEDLIQVDEFFSYSQVQIIGICIDNEPGRIKKIISKNSITYSIAISKRDTPWLFGGFMGVPVSFLLDSDKNIIKKYTGYRSKEKIISDIKYLLE